MSLNYEVYQSVRMASFWPHEHRVMVPLILGVILSPSLGSFAVSDLLNPRGTLCKWLEFPLCALLSVLSPANFSFFGLLELLARPSNQGSTVLCVPFPALQSAKSLNMLILGPSEGLLCFQFLRTISCLNSMSLKLLSYVFC